MTRLLAPCVLALATFLGHSQQASKEEASSAVTARYKAASEILGIVEAQRSRGDGDAQFPEEDASIRWSLRLAEAAVAAGAQPASQAYADHVQRMEKQVAAVEAQAKMGRRSALEVAVARYFLADARVLLERASKN
jgi:hypothetical protein